MVASRLMVIDKIAYHVRDLASNFTLRYMVGKATMMMYRHILRPLGLQGLPFYEEHLNPYLRLDHGCMVDVGAHVGETSIPVAKRGFTVHAFEPDIYTVRELSKLTAHLENYHVHMVALGERHEIREFMLNEQSGHDSFIHRGKTCYTTIPVGIMPLDEFKIFDFIGLIKIDTEGFEIPVLKGAVQRIKRDKPRLIIEVHSPYGPQLKEIKQILESLDYRFKILYKPTGQPHVIGEPT